VSALLGSLFASRIADPLQRQTFVDQLIRERGLPPTLNGPLNLVTQQITLEESVLAQAGIIGARNSIVFSAYRTRNEPITGKDMASELLFAQANNTQTGADVTWTTRITQLYTVATTFNWSRTVANDINALRTNQSAVQSVLSAPLSLLTSVFAGARFQWINSSQEDQVREAAVFVGMTHSFR
jgi:uncharacterized protein (PEP-CTERM system associated)